MRSRLVSIYRYGALLVFLSLLAGCSWPGSTTHPSTQRSQGTGSATAIAGSSTIDTVAQQVLMNEAHTTAEHYYSNWYDSSPGLVYDKKHKPANYSPNLSLQAGAALIDAGLRWNEPAWVDAGKRTIDHMLTFALDPTYHLFYNSMSVNSDGQDQVMNYQAKPSTQAKRRWR